MSARFIIGDAVDVLKKLPDESVDLVLSSPPFFALRSYLPPDHPDKASEIGSEPTPGEFIDSLLDVVEQCARVLAPHGSLCFELGDTYSGSGGAGGDYAVGGLRAGQAKFGGSGRRSRSVGVRGGILPSTQRPGLAAPDSIPSWPMAKSLCMIPELFRVSLVYGFNPLTSRETERWRARNVVRWVRPNPPVGALADKFRPATSELVVVCKSDKRYFDLDAVRSATGAPPLDWWDISGAGYSGAHYAVYPPELCVTPIKAMCPTKVCEICGEPWRRKANADNSTSAQQIVARCSHPQDKARNGVVLDPFSGSGTTLMVAIGHGRDAIGCDIDERNALLAQDRCGIFLEISQA